MMIVPVAIVTICSDQPNFIGYVAGGLCTIEFNHLQRRHHYRQFAADIYSIHISEVLDSFIFQFIFNWLVRKMPTKEFD